MVFVGLLENTQKKELLLSLQSSNQDNIMLWFLVIGIKEYMKWFSITKALNRYNLLGIQYRKTNRLSLKHVWILPKDLEALSSLQEICAPIG